MGKGQAMTRPDRSEHEAYYGRYIDLVPDGDVLDHLENQGTVMAGLLSSLPETSGDYRYAPGKWSLKEVLGHVMDAERVFAFRGLVFSRNDAALFPGMEQDDYARAANYSDRSLASILEEYRVLRGSTLHLFRSFSDDMLLRTGTASGCRFTVRSIMYIVAGHELHHMRSIREKYLRPA